MAVGLAELILLGLLCDWLVRKARLPGLVGLLCLGMALGPYAFDVLNDEIRVISPDLRLIALIVILLRAGFEISRKALASVGVRALLLSFIPCICEVGVITLVGPYLLPLTHMESAMLGGVLAAVSPAVVVPLMIKFIQEGRGAKRNVPTLVMAGASCDDAVAIVLCMSFIGMYVGQSVSLAQNIVSVPVSVLTGVLAGAGIGIVLYRFFQRFDPRATKRCLIILGVSIVLLSVEKLIKNTVPFSALLAVMAIGFIILEKSEHMAHEISSKLGKIWVFAQLLLFTLVGAQVNLPVAVDGGLAGAAVILLGLCGRSVGVQICLLRSVFTARERAFVALSYLPKATVQAAIGAAPLLAMQGAKMNTVPGDLILAIAVLSILLTAPVGAVLINWAGHNLLDAPEDNQPQTPAQEAAAESR